MASGNLPPKRREIVVRGDGNCFYRAIALWNDEISDEKHEEIRALLSSCATFLFEFRGGSCQEQQDNGNLG